MVPAWLLSLLTIWVGKHWEDVVIQARALVEIVVH